jgi:hypothetical protein
VRIAVAALRLGLAVLIVAAVAATFAATASRTEVVPVNFFGYFTLQSNLLAVPVLAVSGGLVLARRRAPVWFDVVRAASVTYLVIVGVVYALLLAPLGAAGGVPLPWANTVLHVVTCVLVPLDWLLVADRHPLPLRRLGWVLVYPLVWCAVVLVRGATDGWVPYPFLDQSRGAVAVGAAVLGIGLAVVIVGALAFAATRLRPVALT